MIVSSHQLNNEQLLQLDGLCAECKQIDRHQVAIYRHLLSQYRMLPNNVLYYEDQLLIGFLSTFYFQENECEISIMVSPSSRRQGIARQMIRHILPLIKSQKITMILVSSPSHFNDLWLTKCDFEYQYSEYQMQHLLDAPLPKSNSILSIRQATKHDLHALLHMDKQCFPTQHTAMSHRFQHMLDDDSYQLWIAEKNKRPIGKVHLVMQKEGARLTDLAILPQYQRHGFGSELVRYAIHLCQRLGYTYLSLDVETKNLQALNLYNRLGFQIVNACDFWSIPMNLFEAKI